MGRRHSPAPACREPPAHTAQRSAAGLTGIGLHLLHNLLRTLPRALCLCRPILLGARRGSNGGRGGRGGRVQGRCRCCRCSCGTRCRCIDLHGGSTAIASSSSIRGRCRAARRRSRRRARLAARQLLLLPLRLLLCLVLLLHALQGTLRLVRRRLRLGCCLRLPLALLGLCVEQAGGWGVGTGWVEPSSQHRTPASPPKEGHKHRRRPRSPSSATSHPLLLKRLPLDPLLLLQAALERVPAHSGPSTAGSEVSARRWAGGQASAAFGAAAQAPQGTGRAAGARAGRA